MKEVNQERVNKLIEGIASFGKSEKGITRLAYSKEDFAAQKWLLEQIADLELTVTQDAIGNTFLRREGKDLSKTLPKNGHQFEKVYLFKHPAFVL